MLDCKIDVNNSEVPIDFDLFKAEFNRFYYIDQHPINHRLLVFLKEMLPKQLVKDHQGNVLEAKSPAVADFLATEEAKFTELDQELFVYLYDQLEILEDLDSNTESADGDGSNWVKCTDEPDKRVFYKQENGYAYGSVITDNIIETNFGTSKIPYVFLFLDSVFLH